MGNNGDGTGKKSFWDFFIERDGKRADVKWSTYQALAILVGIVILIIYSYSIGWRSLPVCLFTAGASLACGILVGFLFGIPKASQDGSAQPLASPPAGGGLKANTNLEQISDWLTKIIVGVGLVQLTKIPPALRSLADYLSSGFGTQTAPNVGPLVPSAVVMTIICYFGIFGFLLGYLWARIYLMKEFSEDGS